LIDKMQTMIKAPEYQSHEEFQNRIRKLNELRELGIEPYPHKFEITQTALQLQNEYPQGSLGHSEEAAAGHTPLVSTAGRLVLFRAMGKNAFAHIQDETGRIQVMFNRDLTQLEGYSPADPKGEETQTPIKLIEKKVDLGDILGIEGNLFFTNKGELTIFAKKVTLLCKTLLPLPDKHAGLADKELRYRKRWLDLICNPEVRQTFRTRSQILSEIRRYFGEADFIEVETPVLQSIYGGAEARPFLTKLNALDQEMFLRISLEISLKKLIIGGMNRVFEMGKVFRNEGIDRTHNPEFTMLEAYASYWDYNDMMSFVENLYEMLALKLLGTTKIPAKLPDSDEIIEVDVKAPWKRITMKDSIKHYAGHDVDQLSDEQMRKKLEESGHIDLKKLKSLNRGLLIAAMFEVFVEPHLIQPHHITDHPIETTPLCKLHRNPKERAEGIVERFESFVLRQEICNAYSELNDPVLQRQLLENQAKRREAGDEEASPMDEEFLEAICQGMPPTGGIGIGIDRLVMLFTQAHSIRDVLYFPWMKPQ
jgi:lysyl-tRNA synthetase class 2